MKSVIEMHWASVRSTPVALWPGLPRGVAWGRSGLDRPSSLAQAALTKSLSVANSPFQPNRPIRPSARRATWPRVLPSFAPLRPTRRAGIECSRWCASSSSSETASIRPAPKSAGVFRWVTTTSGLRGRVLSISTSRGIDGLAGRQGWTRLSVSWNSLLTAFWWTTPAAGSPRGFGPTSPYTVTFLSTPPPPPEPPWWWHSTHDLALKTGPSPSPEVSGSLGVHS